MPVRIHWIGFPSIEVNPGRQVVDLDFSCFCGKLIAVQHLHRNEDNTIDKKVLLVGLSAKGESTGGKL